MNDAIKIAGVGADWAEPLAWIIGEESSGNPTAQNPKSTAYGLMQFLDSTWGNYGYQKTSDPVKQVVAGIDYIKKRYGTPQKAVAFHQQNGWY
ncbi:transglycosylase SLT domain-containing protein [Phosphitispora fastidiosa]|uniref:aggregation-promoting factor C-terminal-like domain-containing protein n=1 Tax=Phosphitispora fastidiosa TaxID=2837202 RepID=UPI00338E819E